MSTGREKLSPPQAQALRDDAAAVRVARGSGALLVALGRTVARLRKGDLRDQLGYSKLADYARERLGIAPRTLFYWLELAEGLRTRPFLERAVLAGLVSPRKAVEILDVAVGDDERAWTAAAACCPLGELRRAMRSQDREPPRPECFVAETIPMTPDQQGRLDAAIAAALELIGFGAPRWQCEEAIAQEWLGTFGGGEAAEEVVPEAKPRPAWKAAMRFRAKTLARQLDALDEAVGAVEEEEEREREIADHDALGLDGRARRLVAAWKDRDLAFGAAALLLVERGTWRTLGYRSFEEYCRERLGMSARAVRRRVFLERKMRALQPLREALVRGVLSFSKAEAVARDACGADVQQRIADAAATTCQQTERRAAAREERKNRAAGVRRVLGPRDAMETVMAAIASCQAQAEASGTSIDRGEALATLGSYFVAVHAEELKRGWIPADRREVLMRHGGLCAVPGCSRPAQHVHHIEFRSRGGSDDKTNLVGLCAPHHLRGIHRGYLELAGRAGEFLLWKFKTGEVFETRGADDVRRVARKQAAAPAA